MGSGIDFGLGSNHRYTGHDTTTIVPVRNDGVGSVDAKQDRNMSVRCWVLIVWVVVGPSFS